MTAKEISSVSLNCTDKPCLFPRSWVTGTLNVNAITTTAATHSSLSVPTQSVPEVIRHNKVFHSLELYWKTVSDMFDLYV